MNQSLLSGNYDFNQDVLDLGEVLKLFTRQFKFQENINTLKSAPKYKNLSFIEKCYDRQRKFIEEQELIEKVKHCLQGIDSQFEFSKILKRLSKFETLTSEELFHCQAALNSWESLQKLRLSGFQALSNQETKKTFKNFDKTCNLIFDEKNPTIIYHKHPTLSPIDKKIKELRKELRSGLAKISRAWVSDDLLQSDSYDILDDHFVLPVRSDRYTSNLGRILYRSNSGNTLFIEPPQLKSLTNQLHEMTASLDREVFKILKAASEELSQNYKVLKIIFSNTLEIDLAMGRASTAISFNLSKPQFSEKTFELDISDIFHPLLEDPISNNVKISTKTHGLLISGPNTGGKTVLLKSIGLCIVLPHLGFYTPCKSALISLSDSVHFISHDNQSLIDGLSSFSSEAINYIETYKNIKEGSILFIDEIFNSTSSHEASNLALSLIKSFIEKGSYVFISSHHEELKSNVFSDGLLLSGHMGFEEGSSLPTFTFHQGSPGKSFAIEVFKRLEEKFLGKQEIFRNFFSSKNPSLNSKFDQLERLQIENNKLNSELKTAQKEVEQERVKIKGLLELEKQKLNEAYKREWKALKSETLSVLDKIKSKKVTNASKVISDLNKASSNARFKDDQTPKEEVFIPIDVNNIIPDNMVFLIDFNKEGRVLKVSESKRKAFVECGKIKSWVNFDKISASKNNSKKQKTIIISVQKRNEGRGLMLDGRGMRREEFLSAAELNILDVINGDLPFVDIIHGHGDGILKRSLYELLNSFKDSVQFDFIEGNLGTTRVELIH